MKKIPVVTSSDDVIKAVTDVGARFASSFQPVFLQKKEDVISFLDYEIPEIKILDFSDETLECAEILEVIHGDPWLHYGGIIGITADMASRRVLEERQDSNILIVQTKEDFIGNFERLLRILLQNQQFLFNRGMQQQLSGKEAGTFICDNDPLDIMVYANFLVSYMYNTNRINQDGRYKLQTALMELLFNALEHGNCGISYDEKTKWLEPGRSILDLIAEKNKDPVIAVRKIHISYEILPDRTKFSIRDEGNGFDWRSRMNKTIEAGTHGMGMKMTENLVSAMTYNDKGNEVFFEIENQVNEANTIPVILHEQNIIRYKDKEVVCYENELTNDLYFIVSGRFAVYSQRKLVSVLTPNDIFIGEMSFLLNDRRSATILSIGEGRLIKIPKQVFLNLIKQNPHYGIFLSRLLAQRLVRQTNKTVVLNEELADLKKRTGLSVPQQLK